jgi:hypothetical protein
VLIKRLLYWKRRRYLIGKYGEEVGLRILSGTVWQGMTSEQLADCRGNPADIGREVYKTTSKEEWKYNQTGKNRSANRIYLENGIVVGWKN